MFGLPRMLFTEEHELFRQSVKDFIAREISPYNAEWEKQKMGITCSLSHGVLLTMCFIFDPLFF